MAWGVEFSLEVDVLWCVWFAKVHNPGEALQMLRRTWLRSPACEAPDIQDVQPQVTFKVTLGPEVWCIGPYRLPTYHHHHPIFFRRVSSLLGLELFDCFCPRCQLASLDAV